MPRCARIILPGIAHHLTQRGNNREVTFLNDADYIAYLTFLHEQAGKHLVVVEGYCLMPNHVHLVLIPPDEMSLARAIGRTHYRYTQYFNFTYQRSGHLWQNRFYSCALDEAHYWKALCYVERNPVRAHMVEAATAYRWSSAAAHLGASDETGLLDIAAWQARMPAEDWCERLGLPEEETEMAILRCTTHTGRPLGSTEFLLPYEELLGRRLHPLSVGRPKKMKGERYEK